MEQNRTIKLVGQFLWVLFAVIWLAACSSKPTSTPT